MADKPKMSKAAKGKAPKASRVNSVKTAAKAAAAKSKTVQPTETYYVRLDALDREIAANRPAKGARFAEYRSFAEAKDRAIDHLIETIDRCERRLNEVRHAETYADYERMHKK